MVISQDFISSFDSLSIRVGGRLKAGEKISVGAVNVLPCVFNIRRVGFKLKAKVQLYLE